MSLVSSFILRSFFITLLCVCCFYSQAQDHLKFNKGVKQFDLFVPEKPSELGKLVVLLHGYGVTDAKCYGGIIENQLAAGNHVLFPRFQRIWFIRPEKYQERVEASLDSCLSYMKAEGKAVSSIIVVGHSMGGVIGANISTISAYAVDQLVLLNAGHKKLKMGAKEVYTDLPRDIKIDVVVGRKDRVASNTFALTVVHSVKGNYDLDFFEQVEDESCDAKAKHEEPLSPNKSYKSGAWNLVVMIANKVGEQNCIDEGYFQLINTSKVHLDSFRSR